MAFGPEISGPVATIVLHVPLVALITVMFLASRRGPNLRRDGAGPHADGAGRGVGRYGAPLAPEDRPIPAGAGFADLLARMSSAEARGDERELVALHLALGCRQRDQGRLGDAADSLRRGIRLAARVGDKEAQAHARLELGDLARGSGDLTTACEHWQLARGLFFELKQSAELRKAEARMRDHGCPTDWVLNDF